MKCLDAQELFSDYVERKLDRAMTVSFENHLSACQSCKAAVTDLAAMWKGLDALPQAEPPAFFHENIMSAIERKQSADWEALEARRSIWNLRRLFQPRNFAVGFAALALVLMGLEAVQTQRASLGPLGWVVSQLRGGSPFAVQSAKWDRSGGVTLSLRSKSGILDVQVRDSGRNLYMGQVAADHVTAVSIPAPAGGQSNLSIAVRQSGSEAPAKTINLGISPAE